jgi:DNA-binding protein HU-beta
VTNTERPRANLNKQSLADAVASEMGLARSVAYEALETAFDIMAREVAQGGTVSITNFLSMERVEKKVRMARNPHTGERIEVPARLAVRVKVAPQLNQFANSEDPSLTTIRKKGKGPARKQAESRRTAPPEPDASESRDSVLEPGAPEPKNEDYVAMNDGVPGESAIREGSVIRARGGLRRGL